MISTPLSYFDISTQEHILLDKLRLKGRKQELRTILKTLSISKTGMGKTLLVSGCQGIGKTAILQEAVTMTHQWLGGKSLSIDAGWWEKPSDFSTQLIEGLLKLREAIISDSLHQLRTLWDLDPRDHAWDLHALRVAHTHAVALQQTYRQKRQTFSQEVFLKALKQAQGGVLPIPAKVNEKEASTFSHVLLNPWLHIALQQLTQLDDPTFLNKLQYPEESLNATDTLSQVAKTWAGYFTEIARGLYQSERCLLITLDHWEAITQFPTEAREALKSFLTLLLQKLSEEKHLPIVWILACRSQEESWVLSGTLIGELRQKLLLGPLNETSITHFIEQDDRWVHLADHTTGISETLYYLTQGVPLWLTALNEAFLETLQPEAIEAEQPQVLQEARLASQLSPLLQGTREPMTTQVWHSILTGITTDIPMAGNAIAILQQHFHNQSFRYEDAHLVLQTHFSGWEGSLTTHLLHHLEQYGCFITRPSLDTGSLRYRFHQRGNIPCHNTQEILAHPPLLFKNIPATDLGSHVSLLPFTPHVAMLSSSTRSSSVQSQALSAHTIRSHSDTIDHLARWVDALIESPETLLLQLTTTQRDHLIASIRQAVCLTETPSASLVQRLKEGLLAQLEIHTPATKRLACLRWLPVVYQASATCLDTPHDKTLEDTTLQLMKLYAQVSSDEGQAILECLYAIPHALPLALHHSSSLETKLKPMISFTHHPTLRATLWQVIFHSWCITQKAGLNLRLPREILTSFMEPKTLYKLYHWLLQDPSSQVIFSGLQEGIHALGYLNPETYESIKHLNAELIETLQTHPDLRLKVMAWRVSLLRRLYEPASEEEHLAFQSLWEPWLQNTYALRTPLLTKLLFEIKTVSPSPCPEWIPHILTAWLTAPETETPNTVKYTLLELLHPTPQHTYELSSLWHNTPSCLPTIWCNALVYWLSEEPQQGIPSQHSILATTAQQATHYALAWVAAHHWLRWQKEQSAPLAPTYRQTLQGLQCLWGSNHSIPLAIVEHLQRLLALS
ncbi:MAG: ATP-binding protein [Vampirovibrionales bacterium]